MIYLFDGSFDGLLCCVFEYFEHKPPGVTIMPRNAYQPALLEEVSEIIADEQRARRVWDGLLKKVGQGWTRRLYCCYLSEDLHTWQSIFDFCCYVFTGPKGAENNFGHAAVIALTKMDRSVSRERHRMKAFIRFQETSDGIFYAPVSPDYNVLPLIAGFFKGRYADQRWIIYDERRKYGLYYDGDDVTQIRFDHDPPTLKESTSANSEFLDDKEMLYGMLWRDYFKNTNIPARKNLKLHVQHVPKRYWHYLTEKQEETMMYFIALLPPKAVGDVITALKKDVATRFSTAKALQLEPHLTLKSPFKVKSARNPELLNWFEGLKFSEGDYKITIDGFGSFPGDHPVLFLKPEIDASIADLQQQIINELSTRFSEIALQRTDTHFAPHFTLAYRDFTAENFTLALEWVREQNFQLDFQASELVLFRHDGSSWKRERVHYLMK